MSAAGSAPEIERTLREQGEAIAALQNLQDERLPKQCVDEIPYIDAEAIGKLYSLPSLPSCQHVQDLQLGRGEELDQHQRITVSGARRGLLAPYQFVLKFLAVGHSRGNPDRAQRGKELFVGHSASPALEDVFDQLDMCSLEPIERLQQLRHLLVWGLRRRSSGAVDAVLNHLAAERQLIRNLRGKLAEHIQVIHSKAPCVARVAARYVAAAISLPSRWLQRKAWARRAAGFSRPSDTTKGGAQ